MSLQTDRTHYIDIRESRCYISRDGDHDHRMPKGEDTIMLEAPERNETLTLRLSATEKLRLEEISRRVDRKPSQFVRWLLVRELSNADEERRPTSLDAAH